MVRSKFYLFFLIFLSIISGCSKKDLHVEDCILTEAEDVLISELDMKYAKPFGEISLEGEYPEIESLLDYLSNSQIVGLGEGTHGTAEFYDFKNYLFRKLVENLAFKAIVFEIPWGNALVIDDFVTKGIGTADQVVDQSYYWTYDTEEVRELVQWMRDYNLGLVESEKIHFVGCDPQGNSFKEETDIILDYLNTHMPSAVSDVTSYYSQLPQSDLFNYSTQTEFHQNNIAGVQMAHDLLVDHKEELLLSSTSYDYEVTLMAAHVVKERESIYRTSDFGERRDELMAEYSEWWHRILNDKVAIWAHNNHVLDGTPFNQGRMGTFLKGSLGDDYQIVGFSFGTGSFNAILADRDFNPIGNLGRLSIKSPLCGSVNNLLNHVEGERHYLIFSEMEGEVANYFSDYQKFTQFGAFFNPAYIENYSHRLPLRSIMDVLIHYDSTNESILR
ncbi:MAG: erythromycin esterase family protein [Ekhidna sp.]